MKTISINKEPICTYAVKFRTLYLRMWGRNDRMSQEERYVKIIKEIELANRVEFDNVKFYPVSHPKI